MLKILQAFIPYILHIIIFMSQKNITLHTISLTNFCLCILIFTIKKAKTTKNLLNKKALLIGIIANAPALPKFT